VTSSSVVETDGRNRPQTDVGWVDLESEAVIDRFDELLRPTERTPASKRLKPICQKARQRPGSRRSRCRRGQMGARANWTICTGTTSVYTSWPRRVERGQGASVKTSFNLSLMLLRGMGIRRATFRDICHPKRNAVVGDTVDGRSHAWLQAWTGSWWNYDPTNDSEINEQYVSVGVGRDYTDVSSAERDLLGRRRRPISMWW